MSAARTRRILISSQFAFFELVPPSTSDAVKSSASTSGTANCNGCDSARSGTEISADPKPVMPRMKYALIKMQSTSTMSATARPLVQKIASIASCFRGHKAVYVVLQLFTVCVCIF